MSITIKAKIIKEVFKNGDYRIFGASPLKVYNNLKLNSYNNFTLQGELPYITEGKEYTLEIEEVQNSKYPATYKVLSIPSLKLESLKDLTREESLEILSDITTSERLANNILDAYPNFIELILTEGKEAIDLKQIHGVGEKYLSAYERNINEKYKYYATIQKFKTYEIDVTECKKLYNKYSTEYEMEKAFKENPYYVLIEVIERSFNRADTMLMKLFPELKDSEIRIEALIMDILSRNEIDGSTRINANTVWSICREDYDAPKEWAKVIKEIVTNSNLIYYDDDTKYMAKMGTYLAECRIADFVKEKLENPTIWDFDYTQFKEIKDGVLTEEQLNVLKMLCENNFVILDAGGGTGKSSAMLAVLHMLEYYHKTYKCVTATGKAAKRLSECINGRPTSTIHRPYFRNETFHQDVLIVDEDSFLSVELTTMLISMIDNPNMKILFIGDIKQIPSISAGKVVRDLIESNVVPVCSLTKCFRFGIGGIATVSTMARNGKYYLNDLKDAEISIGKNKDYQFITFKDDINQIVNCYDNIMQKHKLKPQDICVLTPYNIGDYGAYNINNAIQALVNPPKANEHVIINKIKNKNRTYKMMFRENDIVMNTVNNYNALPLDSWNELQNDTTSVITSDDLPKVECMNGEIGKVLSVKEDHMSVQFDENIIVFNKFESHNLILAYASNPYKYQGSQCKWIINLSTSSHAKSLNRQLLYTSLTRATDGLVEIGEPKVIRDAILTLGDDRDTWLKELLQGD